jgi:hypothetical protein
VITKFQKSLFDLSNNLSKKNYKFTDKYTVVYQGKVDTLDLKMPKDTMDCFNCECSIFMKQGICKHLIGLSNSYDLNFFGDVWSNKPKVFAHSKKRGRARKTNRYGEIKKTIK